MSDNYKRSSSSLFLRLKGRLFVRQLCGLISLNLFILTLFFFGMFFYVEQNAVRTTANRSDYLPILRQEQQLELAGCTLSLSEKVPQGHRLHFQLRSHILPEETADARRSFEWEGDQSRLWNRLKSITYRLELPEGSKAALVIRYDIGQPISVFVMCFLILLVVELFSLVTDLHKNSLSISKTLEPLRNLAQATQALNASGTLTPSGTLSPEALRPLEGTLGTINATHLDTRIPTAQLTDELRPLVEALNEMLARIDEAYRSQARFVSDASHELRTPIAVIQGYASLLTRWGTEDPETLQESVMAIKLEADSMNELVEQLLFLARGDNATMHLEWNELDLSLLAEETVKEMKLIDHTHSIQSKLEPACIILADSGLIKQLLRILTDNSLKYTPKGGAVTLSVERTNDQVRLTVSDEGLGISPEALPHVFDRFYRAEESRNRGTGGTGLGLAIAKWIVDRHGGYFELISREGIGTKITVILPYHFTSTPL